MKGTIFTAGVATVGILILASGANASAIKEGKWSMTTTIKMDGMGDEMDKAQTEMENMSPEDKAMMENMMGGMGMKMGAQGGGMSTTITQCLTNDNPVPDANNQEDCEQTHSINGNTVNFEVVCETSRSTGQVTYNNDNMQGSITSTSTENGHETTSTIDISGEYVGPCDQAANDNIINTAKTGMTEKELELKQKELDLQRQELDIKRQQMELDAAADAKTTSKSKKPTLNDVNNAVNTTNNVQSTIGGLRSLLGRQ